MQRLLFIGSDLLLVGYLAAQSLLDPSNSVCLLLSCKDSSLRDEMRQFVHSIWQENIHKDAAQALRGNFTVTATESDDPREPAAIIESFEADQVWITNSVRSGPQTQYDLLGRLIPTLHGFPVQLNFVAPSGFGGGGGDQQYLEVSLAAQLQSSGRPFRVFHVPLMAGEYLPSRKPAGHPFLLFLAELSQLKREIAERYPDYFEYQSLRCCAPYDSHLNLMPARDVAQTLLAIASDDGSAPERYQIVSRENIPFTQLCEWTGLAYDLNLMNVDNPDELNVIDQLFAERIQALGKFFLSSPENAVRNDCELVFRESRFLDEESAIAEFRKIRRGQSAATDEKLARAAALFDELQRKTVPVSEGELSYFTAGSQGTPVVMINAMGQGLRYWTGLLSEFSQHRKVVIWEPRGTASTLRPFVLSDQVNDLDAILSHEGIGSCHLVAWCTGPKVAIEFYIRRPEAVASMVLLNGAYKCLSTPKTLTLEYENNLEGLFRALDSSPRMASVIRRALLQSGVDSEIPSPSEMDGKELALRVLSLKSRDLQTEVLKPFESEASTLNYARQVLDFYSCDIGPKAAKIKVPALLIGAEYDQITSPEFSRLLARTVPSARYVQLSGATHYCLYEQAGTVSELIQDFFNELEDSSKTLPAQQAAYAGKFSKRA